MSLHDDMTRNGLVRPADGRLLGGVCAGLGRRFGIDPWAARLLFILLLMVVPGSQILIYPILWILMPSEVRPAYSAPYGPAPAYAPQYSQAPYSQAQYSQAQYGQPAPAWTGQPDAQTPPSVPNQPQA